MSRIHPRPAHLRIMRIHTPQHNPKPKPPNHIPHNRTKEPRPRPEIPSPARGRWFASPDGRIRSADRVLHGEDLGFQVGRGQGAGGFVAHGVVGEFVAGAEELVQGFFSRGDLRPDEEEGGVGGVVGEEV
ncbi:hypothetical protein N8T08_003674 [Aspergillus melleus]|uniref:Uncharacterized protein n=1 Tax=Aspergillus melleus TaxID=138277 RepID=A0ACC3B6Y3_9EURO|nr:hypothetical protein N8T08_003674 [Aspergillus melleus]